MKTLLMKFLLAAGFVVALVGCEREDEFFSTDDSEFARKQLVKIMDGGEGVLNQRARPVSPAVDTFVLMEIRRSPNNEEELNQPLTVLVQRDTAVIGRYNRAEGAHFELLPDSVYTLLTDLSQPITFAPGEVAKEVRIRLDKDKLDLTHTYALGYTLIDPSSGAVASQSGAESLYSVGVINKYDGVYELTGTLKDYAVAEITGAYPYEVELQTSGPNSVIMINEGDDRHLILNAGSASVYGLFGVEFTFDPATDKIVSVTNIYGQPASNTRSAQLDPTGLNRYDPATRTIDVKYFMLQPSSITTAPHIRTEFSESFEYLRPR